MSLERIHLRKLLRIFYLPDGKRKAVMREDIRSELRKENGEDAGGGDFHGPFWTDAKNHVAGRSDLREQMRLRIRSNRRRERLYPLLTDGFLNWWNEKRRWRNEPFSVIAESVKAQLSLKEVGGLVKVENMLALRIGDQTNRIIYPYFSEEPNLPAEGARLGLWLLSEALVNYQRDDLRILDILRSESYATIDAPLRGNERELFLQKYESVLLEWRMLREEWGD